MENTTQPMKPANCNCNKMSGSLPGKCAPMVFPYIPMQGDNPVRYSQQEALATGTLFPGLDLPFKGQMQRKLCNENTALAELMALDFAIHELGLYLTTHSNDREVLELYWSYIELAKQGREKYKELYGPLRSTDITKDGFTWLNNPWPWEEGGSN